MNVELRHIVARFMRMLFFSEEGVALILVPAFVQFAQLIFVLVFDQL